MYSKLNVTEIERLLKCEQEISAEFLRQLAEDSRASVQNLYRRYLQKREKENKERLRVQELYALETSPDFEQKLVAGVDEVGRGPLAGPVYAAAVILPFRLYLKGLNDSKKLSPGVRGELAAEIRQKAIAWCVASASVEEINNLNILRASHLAMLRALQNLPVRPDHVLVDGTSFPESKFQVTTVVGGDAKCACIAAASILAKVERDKVMQSVSKTYPFYGFDHNKGYGTKEHYQALREFGPCPLHRTAFLTNAL
ncbi:ribonuclease HII [Zhaonella formicivorans]|uniref:ribonuclease HII n=1 Tax=Zhaonella formicivorans TaxID=2528593 RepID=UPI001D12DC66|nr:ribonuclease HII [Zhaonella formicivorans]